MRNILFKIGPISIYSYGFMIAIGIIMAFVVSQKRAKARGISEDYIFSLGMWSVVGGLLGAKLLYIITELGNIIKDPSLLLNVSNGFVVYGGIIGGILTALIYCKIKKEDCLIYFDLILPQVSMAQGFGRIGCLLAGCCYGKCTDSCIGITFHNSHFAPNGISLIPTQIISSIGNFVIFFVLLYLARKIKTKGVISGLYLVLYSIGRFVIEFFRADDRGNVGLLSTSQFIAIIILLAGISVLIFSMRSKKIKKQEDGEKNE